MFTLEEINTELSKFNECMGYCIPSINKLMYDLSADTEGQVKYKEFSSGNIILHLNTKIFEYPIPYQASILWHEFSHLNDLCHYNNDGYMKTVSEIKAAATQNRMLLFIKQSDVITNRRQSIQYMNFNTTYMQIIEYHNKCAYESLNRSTENGNISAFNSGSNHFMYLCGSAIILHGSKGTIKGYIKNYNSILRKDLLNIIEGAFANDDSKIISAYQNMAITISNIEIQHIMHV